MGYINIGTKIGNGAVDNRYRIDYESANIINADGIDRVFAVISQDGSTPSREVLTITIVYKVVLEDQELLAKTITYTASSATRSDLEYDAPTYSGLFNLALARASGVPGLITQAPAVNEGGGSNIFEIPANQVTLTTSISV
jgi:hypothetical protein